MDENTLRVYCRELVRQCQYAERAYSNIEVAIRAAEADTLFMQVHAFLGFAANVSKLLFPGHVRGGKTARAYAEGRAKQLRHTLNIDEHSCLRMRTCRDHLEHFDERLDTFVREASRAMIIDSNISCGSLRSAVRVGGDSIYLRNLTSESLEFTFVDDTCDLMQFMGALRHVNEPAAERS